MNRSATKETLSERSGERMINKNISYLLVLVFLSNQFFLFILEILIFVDFC